MRRIDAFIEKLIKEEKDSRIGHLVCSHIDCIKGPFEIQYGYGESYFANHKHSDCGVAVIRS